MLKRILSAALGFALLVQPVLGETFEEEWWDSGTIFKGIGRTETGKPFPVEILFENSMDGKVKYASRSCSGFLRLNVSAPTLNAFFYVITENKENCADGQIAIIREEKGSYSFIWEGDGDRAHGSLTRTLPSVASVSVIAAAREKSKGSFLAACSAVSPKPSMEFCDCAFDVAILDLNPFEFDFWIEMLKSDPNDQTLTTKVEELIETKEGVRSWVNINVIRERSKNQCAGK